MLFFKLNTDSSKFQNLLVNDFWNKLLNGSGNLWQSSHIWYRLNYLAQQLNRYYRRSWGQRILNVKNFEQIVLISPCFEHFAFD